MYVKADFAFDASQDVYRCPAGETLKYRTPGRRTVFRCALSGPTRARDARSKAAAPPASNRAHPAVEHEYLVDAMQDRIAGSAGLMRLRRSTVEHPFGTIKAWMAPPTSRCDDCDVRTEMALHVLATT